MCRCLMQRLRQALLDSKGVDCTSSAYIAITGRLPLSQCFGSSNSSVYLPNSYDDERVVESIFLPQLLVIHLLLTASLHLIYHILYIDVLLLNKGVFINEKGCLMLRQ